jgi:hypothetical protein
VQFALRVVDERVSTYPWLSAHAVPGDHFCLVASVEPSSDVGGFLVFAPSSVASSARGQAGHRRKRGSARPR